MTLYNPGARLLWTAATEKGWGSSLAATLRSPDINLAAVTDVWLAVVVGAAPVGTAPTLDVSLELKDAAGNYLPNVMAVAQLTGAGAGHVSAGMHIANKPILLPEWGRIAAVVGGTAGPVFSQVAISLYGR
jgi:hypothetical protein